MLITEISSLKMHEHINIMTISMPLEMYQLV